MSVNGVSVGLSGERLGARVGVSGMVEKSLIALVTAMMVKMGGAARFQDGRFGPKTGLLRRVRAKYDS